MVVQSVLKCPILRWINKLCLSSLYNIEQNVVSVNQCYRINTQFKVIVEIHVADLKSVLMIRRLWLVQAARTRYHRLHRWQTTEINCSQLWRLQRPTSKHGYGRLLLRTLVLRVLTQWKDKGSLRALIPFMRTHPRGRHTSKGPNSSSYYLRGLGFQHVNYAFFI